MVTASKPSASINSRTNINLDNNPQVDDPQVYRALLDVHTAIEILATNLDDTDTGSLTLLARLYATVSVSGNYSIQDADNVVFAKAEIGEVAVTLPTAAGKAGYNYTIKHVLGTYTVDIDTTSGETIDNDSAPFTIYLDESVTVRSDGANWYII